MRNIKDYTEKYLENGFEEYQVLYRRKLVEERIKYYNPQKVLEIGCGMSPLFLEFKDIEFTIVEPSDVFCENAKLLALEKGISVHIVKGFLEDEIDKLLNQTENQFDMIICSSLLHEVEKPQELLKTINLLCFFENEEKRTIVHVNVPNADSIHRILAVESGLIANSYEKSERNIELQQYSVFDKKMLRKVIEESGGNIICEGSYFIKPFTHSQMFRMLQEGIIDDKVLDGLYNLEKVLKGYGSEIYTEYVIDKDKK